MTDDALKAFQLSTGSIQNKSSKENGLAISKKIYSTVGTGLGGYYTLRNSRFIKNRNYANGRIDIQAMFQDRLQMNSKPNYIFLNWQTLQIVNRIVSGLIGRWMQRGEKIQVKAIDDLSQKDKQNEYEQIEFIMRHRAELEQLQQQSGVQLIPQDQQIPADKEELNLWQQQFQRIAEEILYELACNDVLSSNGWYDVMKEIGLHDSAECGLIGTCTWMDKQGIIHVDRIEPENAIYSQTKYSDFRDTSFRGHMPSRKISEIRRMWGKEFNPDNPNALTEEQLWQLAQKCREYNPQTNIVWTDVWYTSFLRPYDEWNMRCMEFELKSVDSEAYTVTKTKTTGSTYTQKGYPATQSGKLREKPLDNQKVLQDTSWNIYRGVYLPDMEWLLEWGLKDNMIRPQDPKEIGNAEFSYSFYMYQPYEMRNLAIPEKIEAAVDGMVLCLLKMQQVVARMRPTGAAVDESALQNIDYGLGDEGNKGIDYKKLYDQTGDIYYRGIDAEGNRVPVPITELANSGFLGQMDGLIRNYQFNYQTLKDELGEDPNLISAALQPRVTSDNVEASQTQSEYATDYMYKAYSECMKITARKISCLLKDSVQYGSKAYRDLIKSDDIDNRVFSTDIRFLPTDQEVQQFQQLMMETIGSTPDLVLFITPFELVRVAKEDVKLAETLFRQGQKKMILWQQQNSAQQQQQNAQTQIQSAQAAEQAKQQTMQMELEMKSASEMALSKERQRESLINGFMGALAKGAPIPTEWKGVETELIRNIATPLFAENIVNESQMSQMQMPPNGQQEEQQEQPQGQPMQQQLSQQPQSQAA